MTLFDELISLNAAFVILVVLYALIQTLTFVGIVVRFAGKKCKAPYLAVSIEAVIVVLGSFCAAIFGVASAHVVEQGMATASDFLNIAFFSYGLTILLIGIAFFCRDVIANAFISLFREYAGKDHGLLGLLAAALINLTRCEFSLKGISSINVKHISAGLVPNLFMASGYFFCFSLAAIYPDYRMMLSQLVVVVHGIGQILDRLIVGPRLGLITDRYSNDKFDALSSGFLFGKLLSYMLLIGVVFVFYVVLL